MEEEANKRVVEGQIQFFIIIIILKNLNFVIKEFMRKKQANIANMRDFDEEAVEVPKSANKKAETKNQINKLHESGEEIDK